jgi:hypothetical protein
MAHTALELSGTRILALSSDGQKLKSERDATELIGEALHSGAGLVLIPVERFEDDFFCLHTRVAGWFIQKFVTYRILLTVVGDVSHFLRKSAALRDFICETNRGDHVWFLDNVEELEKRLGSRTSFQTHEP